MLSEELENGQVIRTATLNCLPTLCAVETEKIMPRWSKSVHSELLHGFGNPSLEFSVGNGISQVCDKEQTCLQRAKVLILHQPE